MIVSVHLPKTAGKSFEATLKAHFGDRLQEDYATYPMNTPKYERQRAALAASLEHAAASFEGVDCIHGHFLPVRYLLMATRREVTFVTWMRHPVQRIVSNFYYWRQSYHPDTAQPLHRRVVEEDWSLEQFCLCEEMRNMYGQFFWGFPVNNFGFIGVTEHYAEDLADFSGRYLGDRAEPQRLNVGDRGGSDYQLDAALQRRIEAFHQDDMRLYQEAVERRSVRRAG